MIRPLDRRQLLGASLLLGGTASLAATGPRPAGATSPRAAKRVARARDLGLVPDAPAVQTAALQGAIDRLAGTGRTLILPPGRFLTGPLTMRPATRIAGTPGATVLILGGRGPLLRGDDTSDLSLSGLVLDGSAALPSNGAHPALVEIRRAHRVSFTRLRITGSAANGLSLERVAARISDCEIAACRRAGLFSLDAEGLEIAHNHVHDCADNGILVWRSKAGEDGTRVTGNRIERIRAQSGGTGQNGNGVNLFRAASVLVTGNRISDCAFSAVRGNAASNLQIVANNGSRLGEVALYAEFGFEGAVISDNIIDTAAVGVSVTNFDSGGRLAVVQGNLIRRLVPYKGEGEARGTGIAVEADTAVTGNVVEDAAAVGIQIGWGRFRREVVATGNLIRKADIGIGISRDAAGGAVLVANNMISGTRRGAIRAMDHHVPTGPDLARTGANGLANITVGGNLAV
ncbi:MAG: TIGR03808 family TAT-translocated repetitive protein [Hyphomicrobiaceae bacterium]